MTNLAYLIWLMVDLGIYCVFVTPLLSPSLTLLLPFVYSSVLVLFDSHHAITIHT